MGLFSKSYDDDEIKYEARQAIKQAPMIKVSDVKIMSKDGVVELIGEVRTVRYIRKAEDKIKSRLDRLGLEYKEIVNNLSA